MNAIKSFPLLIFIVMLISCNFEKKEQVEFQSERTSKSATIYLNGKVDDVFPLFGPVREKEWADGWEPEILYTANTEVEEHMIFKTKGRHGEEGEYHWSVSQFRPLEYLIEYTVSTPERIWFIRVRCEDDNDKTKAHISYTYTGLTEKGNQLNNVALGKMYAHNLKDWEEALNHYLKNGRKKSSH